MFSSILQHFWLRRLGLRLPHLLCVCVWQQKWHHPIYHFFSFKSWLFSLHLADNLIPMTAEYPWLLHSIIKLVQPLRHLHQLSLIGLMGHLAVPQIWNVVLNVIWFLYFYEQMIHATLILSQVSVSCSNKIMHFSLYFWMKTACIYGK